MDSEYQTDVEWSAVSKCWSRRTKTEKASIIFGLLFLFLIATIIISLSATSSFVTKRDSGIEHAASSVLERIDFSIDPCVDFYQFACGKFMNQTKISNVEQTVSAFTELNDKVQDQIRALISENVDSNDPAPFNLVKKLYRKCTNTPIINTLNYLKMDFYGWPKVIRWWSWTQLVSWFRSVGYETESILGVRVDNDWKNTTAKILYISQPDFGIDQKILFRGLNNKIVNNYYNRMVYFAQVFGKDLARAEILIKQSLEFEMKLARISFPKEELRNFTTQYNPLTLREVQEKYPYIQWTEYINALLPTPISVNENELVVVTTSSFFENLGELLNETPPHVISNYLEWRAIWTNDKKLMGMTTKQIEIACSEIIGSSMPVAVSSMYVRKHFHQKSREAASTIINKIRHEFKLILKNADWMDEETRKKALRKLGAMFTHIGYPDMLMDDTKIEEYYKNLKMDERTLLFSILSIAKFHMDQQFRKLRKTAERDDWNMQISPFEINAGYLPEKNGIQIPVAILQDPFFSFDGPWYMNFAAIGSFIGHEIIHGFDDMGAQFDLEGKLMDWWKPETKAKYLQRTKCIVEQYGNLTDESTGLKINGINTQGENIADNGGFKASYLAYQKWEKGNGIEPKLPGLNYAPQQLYWISAAQTWCSVSTTELMDALITIDEHSPNRFRVIGSFINSKEFARDFQCSVGSKMNPVKKCEVW